MTIHGREKIEIERILLEDRNHGRINADAISQPILVWLSIFLLQSIVTQDERSEVPKPSDKLHRQEFQMNLAVFLSCTSASLSIEVIQIG